MPLTPYPYPALNACAQIRAILDLPVLVVLDEAYIEFSEVPSKLKWVQQYNNLVVLRTFSKSAGEWKVLDGVNGEQGCSCSDMKTQHVGYSFCPGAVIERCSMPSAASASRLSHSQYPLRLSSPSCHSPGGSACGLRLISPGHDRVSVACKAALQRVSGVRGGGMRSAHQHGLPQQGGCGWNGHVTAFGCCMQSACWDACGHNWKDGREASWGCMESRR